MEHGGGGPLVKWSNAKPPLAAAGPDAESHTEQQTAVREMEQAADDLREMIENTQDFVSDDRTLDNFKRDILELNHRNAMERLPSVISLGGGLSPTGEQRSWNRTLADKIQVAEKAEGDEDDLLSMMGGNQDIDAEGDNREDADEADLTESQFDPFAQVTPLPPAPPSRPSSSLRKRSSVAAGLRSGRSSAASCHDSGSPARVVGSLTLEMAGGLRRGSASQSSFRQGGSGTPRLSVGFTPEPVNAGARSNSFHELRRATLHSGHGSMSSFASGDGSFARFTRRHSTSSLSKAPFLQRDSSQTRVTGKVDYTALLSEQQENLHERKSSMKQYHTTGLSRAPMAGSTSCPHRRRTRIEPFRQQATSLGCDLDCKWVYAPIDICGARLDRLPLHPLFSTPLFSHVPSAVPFRERLCRFVRHSSLILSVVVVNIPTTHACTPTYTHIHPPPPASAPSRSCVGGGGGILSCRFLLLSGITPHRHPHLSLLVGSGFVSSCTSPA